MKTMRMAMGGFAALAVAGAAYLASAAGAQEEKAPAEMPPMLSPEQVKAIWPAGLQKIAGRYVFTQVASPGGLWERTVSPRGDQKVRQVSLNEVPAAFRQRLIRAEIVISDLELPTLVEASQRESPTKRGLLRFYSETTLGKVLVKNLPGVAGRAGDTGAFSGRALLRIDHQSHSNPSVNGVLMQRLQSEPTWGVATLDYADLTASTIPEPPKEGAEAVPARRNGAEPAKNGAAGQPETATPGKGKPAAPKGKAPVAGTNGKAAAPNKAPMGEHDEDLEGETVLSNTRILRGGIEIFAFVEWETRTPQGTQKIHGAVRLLKKEPPMPPAGPAPALPRSASRE